MFRLGFKYDTHTNMLSATKNALVVEEYLTKEIRLRRGVGSLDSAQHPKVHISHFGIIPKNLQPGKCWLIFDLSHPKCESVNNGIEQEVRSLQYSRTSDNGPSEKRKTSLQRTPSVLWIEVSVVRLGRSFLWRMISLSTVAKELHHRIQMNKGFTLVGMFSTSIKSNWHVCSVIRSRPVAMIASGSWGCGAFTSSGEWFQFVWLDSWSSVVITVKELFPIVNGLALWGKQWHGKTINWKWKCDNAAAVAIVNSGKSKDDRAMHLMRSLLFFLAHYNAFVVAPPELTMVLQMRYSEMMHLLFCCRYLLPALCLS